MRNKLIYVTKNALKVREANHFFKEKYGFELEVLDPSFDVLEIQAKTCGEIAGFSAKYAADRLDIPCLKSDSGLYIEALGGLPGPYNAYFDKQIGVEKFLKMFEYEENRKARLEHCFAFCKPNQEAVVFTGGSNGIIARKQGGTNGRWHDLFFIPNGENMTLAQLRDIDYEKESTYWGTAKDDFAKWYKENELQK
jgi:non-canonical purine NTP pyrophosphatase (RdgB/HAM1 family)